MYYESCAEAAQRAPEGALGLLAVDRVLLPLLVDVGHDLVADAKREARGRTHRLDRAGLVDRVLVRDLGGDGARAHARGLLDLTQLSRPHGVLLLDLLATDLPARVQ